MNGFWVKYNGGGVIIETYTYTQACSRFEKLHPEIGKKYDIWKITEGKRNG